ncbi:MAG: ice-binding family protein [Prosthecobacter sp.]|uniref:ice-binding family protein n=1 Tax=Prosthecobacter sp. TaxID=1965333 RepID=UPI0025DF4361|nr:ice-binding family protein [Prosthecobacter sp.]MCF7784686.1 ice-binding family protein [Prosthecobacter sp.]
MIAAAFAEFQLSAAEALVDLGQAFDFSVLAGSGITNTGPTTIIGDVGSLPTSTITGFGTVTLTGTNHAGDAITLAGKDDLLVAYNDAAGRLPTIIYTPIFDLGGLTLAPGVYNDPSSLGITGTLTLDAMGDPNAVWIFQAGSTLITGSSSMVSLIGGAQASNVFWQVGSSATLGTNTSFAGSILASQSITLTAGATVDGRVLAVNAAVTLDSNAVGLTNNLILPVPNAAETLTLTGPISGIGKSVTKTGAGAVVFSVANTYTGATLVTEGTVFVNGTAGTGSVSTSAGTTLGGTGTVSPTGANSVILGGALSPGTPGTNDGVGTLTFTPVNGNVTFASTGTAAFQLGTQGTHGYTVTYDSVGFIQTVTGTYTDGGNDRLLFNSSGAGTLDFSAVAAGGLSVSFANGYTPALHDVFDLVDWSNVTGLSAAQLSLPDLVPFNPLWSWDTSQFASQGVIGIVAVPEPSRAILLMLGLGGLTMRRRRHRLTGVMAA